MVPASVTPIPTCTAPLGKTWKQCTRHGVYPDDRCHLHTEHLSGSHVERSRIDAQRQRLHNDGTVVAIDGVLLGSVIDYLNEVLGAFEGDPDPSELKGKELVARLARSLSAT